MSPCLFFLSQAGIITKLHNRVRNVRSAAKSKSKRLQLPDNGNGGDKNVDHLKAKGDEGDSKGSSHCNEQKKQQKACAKQFTWMSQAKLDLFLMQMI